MITVYKQGELVPSWLFYVKEDSSVSSLRFGSRVLVWKYKGEYYLFSPFSTVTIKAKQTGEGKPYFTARETINTINGVLELLLYPFKRRSS